jgi:hypothetical protein
MKTETKIWLGAGAVLIGIFALARKASAMQSTQPTQITPKDVEAMAQMLIAETSLESVSDEMAQIVWIAVNRARRHGVSVAAVVTPPGSPIWNSGDVYRARFNAANTSSKLAAAQEFVEETLAGKHGANRGFTAFVHPQGMPKPPCADNRVAMDTPYGVRCLPHWIANGVLIGRALFA